MSIKIIKMILIKMKKCIKYNKTKYNIINKKYKKIKRKYIIIKRKVTIMIKVKYQILKKKEFKMSYKK